MIGGLTFDQIDQGEHAYLKKQIKFPMILLSLIAGLIGGLQTSFLKAMCISFHEKGEIDYVITFGYLTVAGLFASI